MNHVLQLCNCPSPRSVINNTAGMSALSGWPRVLFSYPQVPSETFRGSLQKSAAYNFI